MTNFKKVVMVVAVSAMSANTMADVEVSAMTAVRDNLIGMYDNILANSWGTTDYTAGADALEELVKYASTSYEISYGYDSATDKYTMTFEDAGDFNSDTWDAEVQDLEDGVFNDIFGTTDLTGIITADTNNDEYIVSGMSASAMLNDAAVVSGKTFDAAIDDVNTGLMELDKTKIDAAVTAFNDTVMDPFNDDNPTFQSDLSDMTGIDSAFTYALGWDSDSGCFLTDVDGTVTYYDTYEDYAKDNAETDKNCNNND